MLNRDRFHHRGLRAQSARKLAAELARDPEGEAMLLVKFRRFLAAEGLDGEALQIALGHAEPREAWKLRYRRAFGFVLSGLAAACFVFSIGLHSPPSAFGSESESGSVCTIAQVAPAEAAPAGFSTEHPAI